MLMLIAAQLPTNERQALIHYAHAKHTGLLHKKCVASIRRDALQTYPAHWVSAWPTA